MSFEDFYPNETGEQKKRRSPGAGRPRVALRCPCGRYSRHTARLRRHVCNLTLEEQRAIRQREVAIQMGDQIRAYRVQRGVSEADTGKAIGKPVEFVQRLESRDSAPDLRELSVSDVCELAHYLGCGVRVDIVPITRELPAMRKQLKRGPARLDELFAQFPETE